MSPPRPTIWLLSAYRSASHGAWADQLIAQLDGFNWCRLELPGRHFRWRIRGNPLSWLEQLPETEPDLLLATSMVDLATLKGLHPRLARVPSVYYFHENQFAYPDSGQQHPSIDPQMVQLYGALAAGRCLFNSEFNRQSFLQGVERLLGKLPDKVPPGIIETLQQKSCVLPVMIEPVGHNIAHGPGRNERLILWNHRWEYDKNPHLFADALLQLKQCNTEFQLALLGPRSAASNPALQMIEQNLAGHILVNASLGREQYDKTLGQAGIVVSTAMHEFQGLSMLEAVSAGATPLAPDSLCYPEQYPAEYLYSTGDSRQLAFKLKQWLAGDTPAAPDISRWYSNKLLPRWQHYLQQAINQKLDNG